MVLAVTIEGFEELHEAPIEQLIVDPTIRERVGEAITNIATTVGNTYDRTKEVVEQIRETGLRQIGRNAILSTKETYTVLRDIGLREVGRSILRSDSEFTMTFFENYGPSGRHVPMLPSVIAATSAHIGMLKEMR